MTALNSYFIEPPMKEQEEKYSHVCSLCKQPFFEGIEFRDSKGRKEVDPVYCLSCELDNSYLLDLAENVGSVNLAYRLSRNFKSIIRPSL